MRPRFVLQRQGGGLRKLIDALDGGIGAYLDSACHAERVANGDGLFGRAFPGGNEVSHRLADAANLAVFNGHTDQGGGDALAGGEDGTGAVASPVLPVVFGYDAALVDDDKAGGVVFFGVANGIVKRRGGAGQEWSE